MRIVVALLILSSIAIADPKPTQLADKDRADLLVIHLKQQSLDQQRAAIYAKYGIGPQTMVNLETGEIRWPPPDPKPKK